MFVTIQKFKIKQRRRDCAIRLRFMLLLCTISFGEHRACVAPWYKGRNKKGNVKLPPQFLNYHNKKNSKSLCENPQICMKYILHHMCLFHHTPW